MRDLKHLMDEATDHGPSHGIDLGAVLETGHRRVRRRRTGTVLGAAGLVAAVTAGAALGSGLGDGERVTPADEPNARGHVLTLADAQPARAGKEYTVLSSQNNANRDRSVTYREVTDDGSVVFDDGPSIRTGKYSAGTIDARGGEHTWELDLEDSDGPADYVGTSDRWMVWTLDSQELQSTPGFFLLDRESGEHSLINLRSGPASSAGFGSFDFPQHAELGPDDRVYFTVDEGDLADLWSMSLPNGDDLRREGAGGHWDIDGDLLTYSEETMAPAGTLHERDLVSGDVSTFDPGRVVSTAHGYRQDPCDVLELQREGDLVALHEFCRGPEGRQVRVVDATNGDPVLTVRGDVLRLGALTERYLTALEGSAPHQGIYVVDLDSRDLWQVAGGIVDASTSTRGHDDILTWETPEEGRRTTKLWIVDFGG